MAIKAMPCVSIRCDGCGRGHDEIYSTPAAVLTHIDRVPFGAPTPEEIAHDKIAKQHFLEYCDSGKCIRGAAHARKANWHEGFCVSCAYNPYNIAANDDHQKEGRAWRE